MKFAASVGTSFGRVPEPTQGNLFYTDLVFVRNFLYLHVCLVM